MQPADRSTRRQLLLGSAALAAGGGAASAIAACGGSSKPPEATTISTVQQQSDAELLGILLDLEYSAAVAYELVSAHLSGKPRASAQRFLAQERAHAGALQRGVRRLGEQPQSPRRAAQYRSTFPAVRTPAQALSFALDVESTAVSAYADAIPKIVTPGLRTLLASIMTTESEHMAVVLGDLRRPQVPQAFVTGPPPQPEGD